MIGRIGVAVAGEPATEVAVAHARLLAERLHARLIPLRSRRAAPVGGRLGSVAVPVEDPTSAVAAAAMARWQERRRMASA